MARAAKPASHRDVAVQIVRTLRDAGHIAYFAGGCVRDELLGLHPDDYDVATDARPDEVRRLFKNTNEVGVAFGVMLVRIGAVVVEVATFREEGAYTDKRRPDSVHYADAARDARRRDFTINALFLDPLADPDPAPPHSSTPSRRIAPVQGRVIDLVEGIRDLEAGIIRAVGDPDERLAEDHLRALRAVRFSARLAFRLDDSTADAVRRHAVELAGVSRERIGQEVRRMLAHPSRVEAARLMDALGLASPVLDESASEASTAAHAQPTPILSGFSDAVSAGAPFAFPAALAAWSLDRLRRGLPASDTFDFDHAESAIAATIRRLRAALCLTNDERDHLRAILQTVVSLQKDWDSLGVAGRKRIAASTPFPHALAILQAITPEKAVEIRARVEELARIGGGLCPIPFVGGDDLVALGIVPGPKVGAWLEALYDAQLEGRIQSKDDALRLVRAWAAPA